MIDCNSLTNISPTHLFIKSEVTIDTAIISYFLFDCKILLIKKYNDTFSLVTGGFARIAAVFSKQT